MHVVNRIPLSPHLAVVGVSLVLVACGSAGVSSPDGPGPQGSSLTHPAGNISGKITGLGGRPFGIAVSASGTVYVTQQDANSVARYSLSSMGAAGAPISVTADPGDVIFNRAGTRAYASTFYGGNVHVIDVASGSQAAVYPIGSNAYRLALSGDESRLFVSTVNGTLHSVPTSGGTQSVVALNGSVQGIAVNPVGGALFATTTSGNVYRIDPVTLGIQATRTVAPQLQAIAVGPTGTELYVASEQGSLFVLDATSLATLATVSVGCDAFGVAVTPDGAKVYVTCPGFGQLTIIDRPTRTVTSALTLSGTPRRIAFDATGATAVIANEYNWVDVVK